VDPFVGRMGIFRVHQGTVTKDSQLYIGDGRKPFKVGHLFMLQGKEHVEVPSGVPGDIVRGGQGRRDPLRRRAARRRRGRPHPPQAAGLSQAGARPGDRAQAPRRRAAHVGDPDQAGRRGSLPEGRARGQHQRDHGLRPGRVAPARAARPLREVYKFEVNTRPPRIAYRETITGKAEGHHRHKKQTGGAGPVRRGLPAHRAAAARRGFEFVDQVKGGTIPTSSSPRSRRACARCWPAAPSPATRWWTCA
jgi:elongation factor G